MNTTAKYILSQKLFDPIHFQDASFSELEIRMTINDGESKTISRYSINDKGRVSIVEKIPTKWVAYPPLHKPNKSKNKTDGKVREEYCYSKGGILIKVETTEIDTGKLKNTKYALYEKGNLVGLHEKESKTNFMWGSNGELEKMETRSDVLNYCTSQWNLIYLRNDIGQIAEKRIEFIFNAAGNQESFATIEFFNYKSSGQIENSITKVVANDETINIVKFEYLNEIDNLISSVKIFKGQKLQNGIEFRYNKRKQVIGKLEYNVDQKHKVVYEYIRK